jgi:hypothetical protein
MRINHFGEVYCHTAIELSDTLADEDCDPEDVYLSEMLAPEAGEETWVGDIAANVEGETVCYIEAATPEEVIAIAAQVGVEHVGIATPAEMKAQLLAAARGGPSVTPKFWRAPSKDKK